MRAHNWVPIKSDGNRQQMSFITRGWFISYLKGKCVEFCVCSHSFKFFIVLPNVSTSKVHFQIYGKSGKQKIVLSLR